LELALGVGVDVSVRQAYNVDVIDVTCACGRTLRVPDDKAGARGKCSACGKVLVIPAAPAQRPVELPPGPAPVILTLEPRDAPVRSSPPPRPPLEPPVRQNRVIKTRKEEDTGPSGFAALVLRMYLRPVSTMSSLTYYLGSLPMLGKMAIFWAVSLVVVFVNAAAGVGEKAKPQAPRHEAPAPRPAIGPAAWTEPNGAIVQKGGGLRVTLRLEPDPPTAGLDAQIVCEVVDDRTGKPFAGEVAITSLTRTVHAPGGAPAIAQPSPFGPGTQGTFTSNWECSQDGKYDLLLAIRQPGQAPVFTPTLAFHTCTPDELQEAAVDALRKEAEEEPQGAAPVRVFGIGIGLLAVIGSVLGMLITATTVNLAGRVIGSGGSFLAMLVVLAFLSGIVNDARLIMLLLAPVIGSEWTFVAGWGFRAWEIGLYILALMKVYDVDFMFALGIAFLSNIIMYFAAFWILVALTKMFA